LTQNAIINVAVSCIEKDKDETSKNQENSTQLNETNDLFSLLCLYFKKTSVGNYNFPLPEFWKIEFQQQKMFHLYRIFIKNNFSNLKITTTIF
jgi:hypothetical protein